MRTLLDLAPHYHVHQQKPFHLNTAVSVVIVFCGLGASISFMAAVAIYFWCFKGRGSAAADAESGDMLHENPTVTAENRALREKISKTVVEKLPIASFQSVCDKERTSAECCSVCLTEFRDEGELGESEQGLQIRQLPDCGHLFHTECIQLWLASYLSCPLCRSCSLANLIVEEDQRQHHQCKGSTSAPEETSAISPAAEESPGAESQPQQQHIAIETPQQEGDEIGSSQQSPFKVNNTTAPS